MKAGIVENIDEYPWSSWKEYSSDKCPTSLCSTRTVFARISQTDLTELINTPIEDDGQIIDIDTDGYKSVSDSPLMSEDIFSGVHRMTDLLLDCKIWYFQFNVVYLHSKMNQ